MTTPVPAHRAGTVGPTSRGRVDASMGLLNDIMRQPLDPSYAEAAARGPRTYGPRRQVARTTSHLLVAVVLGVGTTAAIVALRTPAPQAIEARTLLEQEVAQRSATVGELQSANEQLSAEISALQAEALEAADPALFEELGRLEVISGAVAVRGPGLVVDLDDAETPVSSDVDPKSRVQDIDLQIVTNGLWAAGAEAIAVNGHRLTSLSAIRGAGAAILVDLAPLNAPYRIEAIGDIQDLQTQFARSRAANHLATLSGTYGIKSQIHGEQELELPGSGTRTLRYAAGPVPDVASSLELPEEGQQ